jgi:hypothetical protein
MIRVVVAEKLKKAAIRITIFRLSLWMACILAVGLPVLMLGWVSGHGATVGVPEVNVTVPNVELPTLMFTSVGTTPYLGLLRHPISWAGPGVTTPVTLESRIDGGTWHVLATDLPASETFSWTAPDLDATTVEFRLSAPGVTSAISKPFPLASSTTVRKRAAAAVLRFNADSANPVTGMPINEASVSELDSGKFNSQFFVPAMLGYQMMMAVLGHHTRVADATFTTGADDAALLADLRRKITTLEAIMANDVYCDKETGKCAMYQVYVTSGTSQKRGDWEGIVSHLDNTFVIVGLRIARNYLTSLERDAGLVARLDALLDRFSHRMWWVDAYLMQGAPHNPRAGGAIDRLLHEGRTSILSARARDEITAEEFRLLIEMLHLRSTHGVNSNGEVIDALPFTGSALEIIAAHPFMTSEATTRFGPMTLERLLDARIAQAHRLGLPAAGATGTANGFGAFTGFTLAPAELSHDARRNLQVLVLPAAGMWVALETTEAIRNFMAAYRTARDAGMIHPVYGLPNYVDVGHNGGVNTANPVYGTLEINQMGVALLNGLSGTYALEPILRQTPGWDRTLHDYVALASRIYREGERPSVDHGGSVEHRANASGTRVKRLSTPGSALTFDIDFQAGTSDWEMEIRFSNADTGVLDTLVIDIDEADGTDLRELIWQSVDTANWDTFATVNIRLGALHGPKKITIRLETADRAGIELDRLILTPLDQSPKVALQAA